VTQGDARRPVLILIDRAAGGQGCCQHINRLFLGTLNLLDLKIDKQSAALRYDFASPLGRQGFKNRTSVRLRRLYQRRKNLGYLSGSSPETAQRNMVDVCHIPLIELKAGKLCPFRELTKIRKKTVKFLSDSGISRVGSILPNPIINRPRILDLDHAVALSILELNPVHNWTGLHTERHIGPRKLSLLKSLKLVRDRRRIAR